MRGIHGQKMNFVKYLWVINQIYVSLSLIPLLPTLYSNNNPTMLTIKQLRTRLPPYHSLSHPFSRTFGKKQPQTSQPSQTNPSQLSSSMNVNRSDASIIRKLMGFCKGNDKEKSDVLLDKEFYGNLGNKLYLRKVINWQNSVAVFYRDFPTFKMGLDNQTKILKDLTDPQLTYIKQTLMYLLTDHGKLQAHLHKNAKLSHKTYSSLYIKCMAQLVLGQFVEAEKILFQMLNTSFNIKSNQNYQEQNVGKQEQINQQLLDLTIPNQLNTKQQILMNLMVYSMLKATELPQNGKKNKALHLYNKIKQKKKLTPEDLILENYESFLNIWLSAKFDQPLEWCDIQQQALLPYFTYIYLMAQNSYIKKDLPSTKRILEYLPAEYPLRQFLELSLMYDNQKYEQVVDKVEEIQEKIEKKQLKWYMLPEYDIVLLMIMEIAKKAQVKLHKTIQQGKQDKIEDVEAQYEVPLILLRYNLNIVNNKAKGIPYYYFNIPFQEFMIDRHFAECFQ